MKIHLPLTALVTIAVFQFSSAPGWAASPLPKALAEPLKCSSLLILPDGAVLITGPSPVIERSYRWTQDSGNWELIKQSGMWGELSVSPLNKSYLSISGRNGFVSKDGGKTWQFAVEQFTEIEGKKIQIGRAFWSTKKPDTLLLSQISGGFSENLFELDLPTGKINPWSKVEGFISRYEQIGEKHFAWIGSTDVMPPMCGVSEDDGKTWKPIPPGADTVGTPCVRSGTGRAIGATFGFQKRKRPARSGMGR